MLLTDRLVIPLTIHGVTSSFPTRKPSAQEYESCPHYDLTFETPDYDPHDPTYSRQEQVALDALVLPETGDRVRRIMSVSSSTAQARDIHDYYSRDNAILSEISHVLEPRLFLHDLESSRMIATVKSISQRPGIDAETLSRNWGIGLASARRTLEATTQRGVRTVLHPTMSRRFRTNDRQLRYRRLPVDMYTDTMFSKTKSRRGNTCAQVFSTANGWARVYPMVRKSQAHEALSLLHQREGVPNVLIMDNSKEQTLGEFRTKCRQAGSHLKQTEPYSPWQNSAESTIRELKKGTAREMIRSQCPKSLWDDCIERESYIRSLTALDIYSLSGQVPETVVSGETADISPFASFKWYEWVYFRDTAVAFPEPQMVLGRDIGPAIDIGPAMTRKILKDNGQVVYRSTVRPLTLDEMSDPVVTHQREAFNKKVLIKLGPKLIKSEMASDPDLVDAITPEYELCVDDVDGEALPIPDIDDADPDTYDQYVGAEVQLSHGNNVVTGVVKRRKTSNGVVAGKAHSNPILDTRTYDVEFPDGSHAEYSANIIAQNMYSQCDTEGNLVSTT